MSGAALFMKLSDFDYILPENLIAQKPIRPRDHSRLLVVDTATRTTSDRHFFDIIDYLRSGDVLVINTSKVIPARLLGTKNTGGSVEVFLVRKISSSVWNVLLKNFRESDIGKTVTIGTQASLHCTPIRKHIDGTWEVIFKETGSVFSQRLARHGKTPTPPYIPASSTLATYQTVYAKTQGSVAAPTAGFHFTKSLLAKIKKMGVTVCTVTLHVGPGTFLPIREDDITKHIMHSEQGIMTAQTAKILNAAKKEGRRVIAVGTTSVRVLESFSTTQGVVSSGEKDIDLFIYPGYQFKAVDALITNFHLPHSTLLLLVSAFAEYKSKGGAPFIKKCYADAIKKKYRFYSFGDSMML